MARAACVNDCSGKITNARTSFMHLFCLQIRFYLLYVDGEITLSGGCLFTFGLTLLTCLMEFNWRLPCCTFNCWLEPVKPPFGRRFRLITVCERWQNGKLVNRFENVGTTGYVGHCKILSLILTVNIFAISGNIA